MLYLKTGRKNARHKAAEATKEFIGNKIVHEPVKPKLVPDQNSRNVEEIIITPGKRRSILYDFWHVL